MGSNVQMQACWANRSWVSEVGVLLGQLSETAIMRHLGFSKPGLQHGAADPIQTQHASIFFNMITNCASCRAWSMSLNSEMMPDNWAGILDSDSDKAYGALGKIRNDKEVVEQALEAMLPLADGSFHPDREDLDFGFV
jgi:hypothetical protein